MRLTIRAGRLAIASLHVPGFAAAVRPDTHTMREMPPSRWRQQ